MLSQICPWPWGACGFSLFLRVAVVSSTIDVRQDIVSAPKRAFLIVSSNVGYAFRRRANMNEHFPKKNLNPILF